ncbi:MAG: hypothetical protein A2V66_06740 [Ignavibacteria bacterium RBG_13_36_8]|nr:MAG: hypothetical protein A2V66_06740 [Ignavibacteria bacterium RBG_13_36_8]
MTTVPKLFICISIIILFSESIYAQSNPPLLLDDPGTPGSEKWEINIMTSLEHSTVNDEWQMLLFDINYGLGDRSQIAVSLPYVVEWSEGTRDWLGFDGVELGFKYRFLDQSEYFSSDISFYPKIYFSFESEASSEFSLPFEFHKEWLNFGLTAEIGHIWVQGGDNRWEGGVGFAISFDRVKLLGEWHTGVREAPLDLAEPMVNVGLTWEWLENVSLYFSFGKSLHSHEDETNFWSLCGIQLLF